MPNNGTHSSNIWEKLVKSRNEQEKHHHCIAPSADCPDGGRQHEQSVSSVKMNFVASQQKFSAKNIISLHFLPQNLEVTENIPIFAANY